MDTCLLPGSPYITLVYKNAGIVLQSGGGAIEFSWVTPGKEIISFICININICIYILGEKAKVTTPFGGTYVIYVTGLNVELTANQTHIVSGPGTTATLRIAKVQDPAQEAVLDAHKGTYPTGLDFRYAVAGDTATLTWTWDVVGNADELLMLSWHHHRVQLQTPDFVNIEYLTLKGPMRGVRGNVWNLKYDLPTINWFAENDVHPSCLVELEKTLEFDVAALKEMNPGDFYFWGGAVGRAARLALIAEHVGKDELIPEIVAVLKKSIDHWFDPTHVPAAAYETGWGGLINREGWNNSWVDFGNAYYNDHHFHYGYILEAAAVIGKYEPAWLQTNIDFFTQ
jgi:endo-1,3(4)-beta-glucanase